MSASNGSHNYLGVNISFTKFLFISPRQDDDAARMRVRGAGAAVARGFFNDFDADGGRDAPAHETIHFLLNEAAADASAGLAGARYVAQVSTKYRPRLKEVEGELRRRLGDGIDLAALEGATQGLRYTSAELYAYAYKAATPRLSGRIMRNAIILPIRKTREWWEKSGLERHAYFYPHADLATGSRAKGHAHAAEAGIPTIFRRLYHNPDGYQRENEFDFITYFECADEHLGVFDHVRRALRDQQQNPEWRYVIEGPEWRGRRVLRW